MAFPQPGIGPEQQRAAGLVQPPYGREPHPGEEPTGREMRRRSRWQRLRARFGAHKN